MKLEMTMKEMQELVSKKGQVEIMGKTYVLNPQDELLIKFIMDYKEKRPMDYYDIISTLFNNALLAQPGYGQYCQPMYPQQQMWSNGCYPAMQPQFINQAPQMSYDDIKNMYKRQFASQLGLDIDGDEEEHPCTCCSNCDGNCEENIVSETTEEEKEIAKDIVNKVEKEYKERLFGEDRWCDNCVAMGIECDDNCDKHHADFDKIKSMINNKDGDYLSEEERDIVKSTVNKIDELYTKCMNNGELDEESKKELSELGYKLGYQDGHNDGKQDYINGIPDVQTIPNTAQFDPELLQSKFREKLAEVGVYGAEGRRFTGKKDINGNNIYEGDVLKCKLNSGKYENYAVLWNLEEAGFEALNHDKSNFMSPSIWNEFEVIGNIIDNPELMKEESPKGKPVITGEQTRPYKVPKQSSIKKLQLKKDEDK